jgi:hypothetical protein
MGSKEEKNPTISFKLRNDLIEHNWIREDRMKLGYSS